MTNNDEKKRRNRGKSLRASEYNMLKFTNILYSLRKKLGRTQEEMAKSIGVSTTQYARHEQGLLKQLSIEFIYKVCTNFNIDKNEWLERIPEETIETNKIIMAWVTTPDAQPYLIEAHKKFMIDKITDSYKNPSSLKNMQNLMK